MKYEIIAVFDYYHSNDINFMIKNLNHDPDILIISRRDLTRIKYGLVSSMDKAIRNIGIRNSTVFKTKLIQLKKEIEYYSYSGKEIDKRKGMYFVYDDDTDKILHKHIM